MSSQGEAVTHVNVDGNGQQCIVVPALGEVDVAQLGVGLGRANNEGAGLGGCNDGTATRARH